MSENESSFSTVHYMITLIFFIMILGDILGLLRTTYNMKPLDSNTETAQNLMYSAVGIGLGGELLIIIFVIFTYMYSSSKNETTISYYDKLMGNTGAENLYEAMRIVSFSILMFISIVIAALCFESVQYINSSSLSSSFTKEINECKLIAETFTLHFVLFTSIQFIFYIYQLLYSNGTVNISPGQIATGKKIE